MRLESMLCRAEGKRLEFKRDLSSPKGVLRTLAAFANTSGGILLVGVADDRSVKGVPDVLAEEERLANLISDGLTPRLVPNIEVIAWRRTQVLAVEVYPSAQRPHHVRAEGFPAGAYVRVGSSNRPADAALLSEMRRLANDESFDETPLPALDSESLDFRAASELFAPRRPLSHTDLLTLRLLCRHQGRIVPSVGGIVLIGRDPQAHFPDAWLQCGRFAGATKARIADRVEVRGTLPAMLDGALAFVRKHALLGMKLDGLRRTDCWSVPMVAVREALVNAVVHADYAMTGRPLRLAIYDDRLEVENPGLLPLGMTIEGMQQGVSKLRNRTIGRVFRELGLIEQWGSGVPRMFAVCRETGLADPLLEELGFGFRVTISLAASPRSKTSGDATEKRILALLAGAGSGGLSTHALAGHLEISDRAVRVRMAALLERGLVRVIGKGPRDPGRRYHTANTVALDVPAGETAKGNP